MKCNKQLSLAGIIALGAIAFGSGSLAADLPAAPFIKAPAPVPPLFSWTGGYIGGSVGSGWGTGQADLGVGNTFIGAPVNQTANQLIGGTVDLNVPLPQVRMNGFLGLRLPTSLSQSFAPVAISMNRDNPRHMMRFPGGGSLARAR